ncbi:hypothetical protein DEU56DRAFT_804911 [Suillus clintonianus]|uniref:uncharacterized protein n=1 Tax=Suillus clintonianus TaxID=1904413 RepID=UPI001B86DE53|nr:uncharacterized protein DEU56DRAFT_804911 [Suillus clintonianus]KAG2137086.1 hypothetical protein DEU56DRAFT_804911 [Suillus clintonianus]
MEDVDDYAKTIYEFDASTLETVGTPFEGHTDLVTGLALSSDSTLLASASYDHTIKLWAFEHRQLLATFNVRNPVTLVLSPDSCQLAYTTSTYNDNKIYVCSTPLDVLAQVGTSACKNITLDDVLKSNATRRLPVVRRKPPIYVYVTPMSQRPPTIDLDPQQPISLRLRRLLLFTSRTNAVPPNQKIRNNQLRGPLDVCLFSSLFHS